MDLMFEDGERVIVFGFRATINGHRFYKGAEQYYCSFSAHGSWVDANDIKKVK